jgi:hypothetical protein
MIRVINQCIFETVTDTNMKCLENSMETHKVYLEMFDMYFITYSANAYSNSSHVRRNCDSSTLAMAREISFSVGLWDPRLVYLVFTYPQSHGVRSRDVWVLFVLSKPFALETPFSFDNDWSAARG